MTLDKEKISVCAWFYSFLRINKTVAFFRLFKLLLHTRAQFFFTAAKPIVNFFVDSFIYLFIHFPISSTVRHNFPRLRTNDCGIKTEISLTDVYETQTSSLFCLEARSGDAASAAIYDTLYGFISGIHFNLSTKLMALKRQL
jgi:hypothetical protein